MLSFTRCMLWKKRSLSLCLNLFGLSSNLHWESSSRIIYDNQINTNHYIFNLFKYYYELSFHLHFILLKNIKYMLTYDKIRKCKFMKNYCRFSVDLIPYF